MVMFNSVVFHVAGEFVAVEGWTVVSFQNVGISESAKNSVHFVYYFRRCESLEWYDLWVTSEVVDDNHNVFSVSNVGKVTTDLIAGWLVRVTCMGSRVFWGVTAWQGKQFFTFSPAIWSMTGNHTFSLSSCLVLVMPW